MKISSKKIFAVVVRTLLAVSIVSCFCFFVVTVQTKKMGDDIWKQLGLTVPDAQLNIKFSIMQGSVYHYGAKNARNLITGNRTAVINDIVASAKKYCASAEFKAAYKKQRDGLKPKLYEYEAATPESIKAQEMERLKMSLKSAEEAMNSTNPKVKNGAPARIESIKKEIAELDNPDNKNIKRLVDQDKRMYESVVKQNEEAMKKFDEQYPENPQVLIKRRLEEILKITSDIDYNAELTEKTWQNKTWKVFVNPLYEKKSKDWKLAFRAGKQTTDAVRAAAENWLKEFK